MIDEDLTHTYKKGWLYDGFVNMSLHVDEKNQLNFIESDTNWGVAKHTQRTFTSDKRWFVT